MSRSLLSAVRAHGWRACPVSRAVILSPRLGGADGISAVTRQVHAALAERYGPAAVEIWTLSEEPAAPPKPDGSPFWTAGASQTRFALHALSQVTRSARNALVVVLHAGLAPAALPLVLRGGRLVVFLHGIEIWKPLGSLDALALGRAWKLVANSHETARRFQHENPRFAQRSIEVCHLGCPAPVSYDVPTSSASPFALIVGRLNSGERYKGHDLLLEVWPRVIDEVPAARLVVAGAGDDLERLRAKAQSLGLGENVEFLGRVSDEKLAELYRDCSLYVMPSTGEGFGLVFVEAMLAGKPCIGAPGAAQEIIDDGQTGCIVDPARPDEVRTALIKLFRDLPLRAKMGQAGRERARREFSDERFRQRFLDAVQLPS